MTQMRTAMRSWSRGALLVATMAACQLDEPTGPQGSEGNEDVSEELAALSATPLTNDVPVTGISGSAGTWRYYSLDVPEGQSTVTFTTSGGTGDVDLYVNFGALPTATVY